MRAAPPRGAALPSRWARRVLASRSSLFSFRTRVYAPETLEPRHRGPGERGAGRASLRILGVSLRPSTTACRMTQAKQPDTQHSLRCTTPHHHPGFVLRLCSGARNRDTSCPGLGNVARRALVKSDLGTVCLKVLLACNRRAPKERWLSFAGHLGAARPIVQPGTCLPRRAERYYTLSRR